MRFTVLCNGEAIGEVELDLWMPDHSRGDQRRRDDWLALESAQDATAAHPLLLRSESN